MELLRRVCFKKLRLVLVCKTRRLKFLTVFKKTDFLTQDLTRFFLLFCHAISARLAASQLSAEKPGSIERLREFIIEDGRPRGEFLIILFIAAEMRY